MATLHGVEVDGNEGHAEAIVLRQNGYFSLFLVIAEMGYSDYL